MIQTLLIWIRILLFTLIPIRILFFNLIRIWIWLFDTDPDPYHFKEVMNLKQYFLYILTCFSLSVGPTRHTLLNFLFQLILLYSLESWCTMSIDYWCLMFTGSKYLEHISRIRTEHLLNNRNTEQKNWLRTWIKTLNQIRTLNESWTINNWQQIITSTD